MLTYSDMMANRAPEILGLKLRPLSLGHIMHMQSNQCIFLSPKKINVLVDDPEQSVERLILVAQELLFACLVCSMTYEEFTEFVNDQPEPKGSLKLRLVHFLTHPFKTVHDYFFNKEFSSIEQVKKWGKTVKKKVQKKQINLLEEINRFHVYLTQGYQEPAYEDLRTENNKLASGSSVNWPHTIIATLCSELKYSRSEILNQSLNATLLDFYKVAEKNGLVHLLNDNEQVLMEASLARLEGGNNVS